MSSMLPILLLCLISSGSTLGQHQFHPHLHPSFRQSSFQRTTLQEIKDRVNAQRLSTNQKKRILISARDVIKGINPHRFIHLNYLKVDVVSLFNDLLPKLSTMSNWDFHMNMIQIFQSMDDFHTIYSPPEPIRSALAVLNEPDVTTFYKPGASIPTYYFGNNVTILSVDDVPVHKYTSRLAARGYAANRASRITVGTQALTFRRLAVDMIPSKSFTTFRLISGTRSSTWLVKWQFYAYVPQVEEALNNQSMLQGEHLPKDKFPFFANEGLELSHLRKKVIPDSWMTEQSEQYSGKQSSDRTTIRNIRIPNANRTLQAFEVSPAGSDPYGLIRISTFEPSDAPLEVVNDDFRNVLKAKLSKDRLVVDIRGNPGGQISLALNILDSISSKVVPPLPVVFRASGVSKKMTTDRQPPSFVSDLFRSYRAGVNSALTIGERFTGPVDYLLSYPGVYDGIIPFQPNTKVFNGSLILLTDALTFSAGDFLASWVKDTGAGLVVGVDGSTAGGGANVISFNNVLRAFLPNTFGANPLALGTDFNTALFRVFRSGQKGGAVLENFGVRPNVRYFRTKADVDGGDMDLLTFLGKLFQDKQ